MLAISVALVVAGVAEAATITFKNGRVERDVEIVNRDDESVSVMLGAGLGRFDLSVIQSIDGKPVRPEVTADVDMEPVEGEQSVPNLVSSGVLPPEEEFEPDKPWVVEPELPQEGDNSSASSVAGSADDGDADGAAGVSTRWNFAIALLALLVLGGVWMRSVQAVQKDLWNRGRDSRVWSLVALLLPIVGAILYLLWRGLAAAGGRARAGMTRTDKPEKKRKASKKSKNTEAAEDAGGASLRPPGSAPGAEESPAPAWKNRSVPPLQPLGAPAGGGFEFVGAAANSTLGGEHLVSGLQTAEEILDEALSERASDVHIEPSDGGYRVRHRLDGILHEKRTLDSTDGKRLVTSIKTLAEVDIAEKRKAQDGKFRVRVGGREVDFRVATANSIYGEKVVIRILDNASGILDLTSLGMSDEMLAQFDENVNARNGMILATGPTGSGKTSTLYAALRTLDATKLNIMTIEDPAEYELAGATQIAVNPKAGITFESGLRSILRQDPDVILIGEMRDAEATEVALRAALTGHLVLSSLHTKDAMGTIARLQDMRIERYQTASALLMIVAQRLVRTLCPTCRKPYECEGNELESLGFSFDPGTTLYAADGCGDCRETGFRGRTGIFELLVFDDELRKAIGDGVSESDLLEMAREKGYKNYRQDGAEKILLGITTVEEVLEAS
ncbi:MAG: ATPase, T2SS/T4P/T4SS family [Chthoniobacterales bacterium]